MKTFLLLLLPLFTLAQPPGWIENDTKSIVLHGDTTFIKNWTRSDSVPILSMAKTIVSIKDSAKTAVTLSSIATALGYTPTSLPSQISTADIAATASATPTATLFTPTVSGLYRVSAYLKITTTGTSPVAGPVTITYTDADGSVAQSHVMSLKSVTGSVVTTTVNNSTTTGTVNGSIVINAKSGVAIQYAIAVSGTFGSGRYTAHLVCERLK